MLSSRSFHGSQSEHHPWDEDGDSNLPGAWHNKGLLLYTLKRYDEALAAFERAIEIDASVVGDWTYKGKIYHDLKRYNEALIALAGDRLGFLFGEERIHLLVVETLLMSTVATASHGVCAHREQGHKEESKTYLSPSDGMIRVLVALLAGLANLS